ncbi:hypothetical protein PGB90_006519 [Kerria lacca]
MKTRQQQNTKKKRVVTASHELPTPFFGMAHYIYIYNKSETKVQVVSKGEHKTLDIRVGGEKIKEVRGT